MVLIRVLVYWFIPVGVVAWLVIGLNSAMSLTAWWHYSLAVLRGAGFLFF